MDLTGKCLRDFAIWYTKTEYKYPIGLMPNVFQNALIIEFFDSISYGDYNLWNYCFSNAYWNRGMKEYMESVKQAIIKANEIYNENIRTDKKRLCG